jgi:type II secretory pathway predicted ATPase ExeA
MRTPFSLSPNPVLMYTPPALLGALEKIRFMIAERQGLALILGDNGIGKSTVLRYLEAEYSAEGYKTALLNQTEFPSPYALLKAICAEFHIDAKRSQVAQHKALEEYLLAEFKEGRTVILFIDEGQRLNANELEVIRALLNFETYEHKLLQIVLAGTLDLRDRIMAKRNKALRSRVFAPCLLNVMMPDEIAGMIEFRCGRAGIPNPFDEECTNKIASLSGGIPRAALLICAHAWNLAKRLRLSKVPPELIQAANEESTVVAVTVEAEAVTA